MPHVVVKMKAGRTEEMKRLLAERLTEAIVGALGCEEQAVSIAVVDVPPERWSADVYEPEIAGKLDTLYKKPGYWSGAKRSCKMNA